MNRRTLLLAAFFATFASTASAQSLFGTRGLGVRVDPADARARALGSVGIGLLGFNGSLVNPAEISDVARRGVTASIQPFYGSDTFNGEDDNVAGTRFPVVQILYPIGERTVFSLGYGGVYDQSWAIVSEGTETVGGEDIGFRDVVSSTGGVSQVRFSGAYRLSPSLSLGAGAGVYTGNVNRELLRSFPDTVQGLPRFRSNQAWGYSGPFAVVGAQWDPASTVRIGGALTWSGKLDADHEVGDLRDRSYDLPLRANVGASAVIGRRLLATASAEWEGWSDGNYTALGSESGPTTTASSAWIVGGGVEWEELRTSTRVFPLRAGFRYAQLPFHNVGEAAPKEWAITGGVGFRLAADDFGPLALADVGIERGRRTGWEGGSTGGLDESFWRLTASISLFAR